MSKIYKIVGRFVLVRSSTLRKPVKCSVAAADEPIDAFCRKRPCVYAVIKKVL